MYFLLLLLTFFYSVLVRSFSISHTRSLSFYISTIFLPANSGSTSHFARCFFSVTLNFHCLCVCVLLLSLYCSCLMSFVCMMCQRLQIAQFLCFKFHKTFSTIVRARTHTQTQTQTQILSFHSSSIKLYTAQINLTCMLNVFLTNAMHLKPHYFWIARIYFCLSLIYLLLWL